MSQRMVLTITVLVLSTLLGIAKCFAEEKAIESSKTRSIDDEML